ncbi:MAG TPA: CAP domain-containing protein [Kofleriaceae bacterium]|jgi:uncharacterized protein YkwD
MRWLSIVGVALVACGGGGPQQIGAQPSWRTGSAAPVATVPAAAITFAPASDPARRYNEPLAAPPKTPLGVAMMAALRDAASKAHLPTPIADPRLYRACSELAEIAPAEGMVRYAFVEFALQRNGIIEPAPHVFVVWGSDAPDDVIGQLKPQLDEVLGDGATVRFGIGTAKRTDGATAIVFAVQGSGVTTSPIPRALAAGGTAPLDAVVDSRYKDPEVFITREDGATERLALDLGHSGAFKTTIACAKHVGRQQVEISASDTSGSTVLANFPVWCAAEPPVSLTVAPDADDADVESAGDAEKRLLALANRDRAAAGLPALLWDDRVAAVARGYSEEMHRTKVVAHVSPTSGSPADRVRAGNVKTAVVLENVARAYGVGEAHAELMNSPGHRANLMSPVATHVGIGVVLGDEISGRRELYLTEVFIRIPPKIDPAAVAELVRSRIDLKRHVAIDPTLVATAQEVATGLAAGHPRDELWPTAKKELDKLGARYARVGSVITAVVETDSIDGASLLGDYKPDDIGVGVAQGMHPQIGENAIWIVVLMAERLDTPAPHPPPPPSH